MGLFGSNIASTTTPFGTISLLPGQSTNLFP
jgi:hypothetical protein